MSRINELLDRTLLVKDRSIPRDVVAAAQPPTVGDGPVDQLLAPFRDRAADDLRALCETLIARTPAADVNDFVTDQVPEPRSAVILACLLQLTDTTAGARFWWQYAAGAGLPAAAYCLYLHHLTLGEDDTANWWHCQIDEMLSLAEGTPPPAKPTPSTDPSALVVPEEDRVRARAAQDILESWGREHQRSSTSVSTILRVLRHLGRDRTRHHSTAVNHLMNYVSLAVTSGYLRWPGTVDLPTPGADFAQSIAALITMPSTTECREECSEYTAADSSSPTTASPDSECLPRRKPTQPRHATCRLASTW